MDFNLRQEFHRKMIHLSSAIYPIIYIFLDKKHMLYILSFIFLLVFLWDIARIKGIKIKLVSLFAGFIRAKEKNRFVGAVFFLASIVLVVAIFPKDVAIVSMFILIFCDTVAALVGQLFGKITIKSLDKTLEGFLAFNVVGFIIIFVYLSIFYENIDLLIILLGFIPVFMSSLAELFSNKLRIDDNFSITLVFATLLFFLL